MRLNTRDVLWLSFAISLSAAAGGKTKQDNSCITPDKVKGVCVHIKQCRNIYQIIKGPRRQPEYDLYIGLAACMLPGIPRSICCKKTEIEPQLLPENCGVKSQERSSFGNKTEIFEYPWMALLRYKDKKNETHDSCGGSLISARYVLTAAHCITPSQSDWRLFQVRLGEHNRSRDPDCNIHDNDEENCAGPVEDFGIKYSVVHESYDKPHRFANDIALIRLSRRVKFSDDKYHIRPICLPVTPNLRAKQFDRYVVTGWGATENSSGSDVLLEAGLRSMNTTACQQRMKANKMGYVRLTEMQLCAGGDDDKVEACKGDSGGPLGIATNNRFVQYGIVSFGISSCGVRGFPGVFVRVASYMDWILNTLEP